MCWAGAALGASSSWTLSPGPGSVTVTCGQHVPAPLPAQAKLRLGPVGERGNRKAQVQWGHGGNQEFCYQGTQHLPSHLPDPRSTCEFVPRRGTAPEVLIALATAPCPTLSWVRSVTSQGDMQGPHLCPAALQPGCSSSQVPLHHRHRLEATGGPIGDKPWQRRL